MPGMVGTALGSLLRRDAPLYVNPRPDAARARWLLGFARNCTWARYRQAGEARGAILARSRVLLGDLVASEGMACEFEEVGELYVYRQARTLRNDQPHVDLLRRLGMDVRELDADQAMALEPGLRDGVVGALLHPGDARLRPDRYVAELARRVRELGGAIETGARVDSFVLDGARVSHVRTTRGVFQGDRVVMALGAWSPLIGKLLDIRLPMQPGKGYSLTWERPPEHAPRHSLVLREAAVCVTPWASGFRLGSTMEFSGFRRGPQPVAHRRVAAWRGHLSSRAGRARRGRALVGLATDERGRGADHRPERALVEPDVRDGARHARHQHVGGDGRAGGQPPGGPGADAGPGALFTRAIRVVDARTFVIAFATVSPPHPKNMA